MIDAAHFIHFGSRSVLFYPVLFCSVYCNELSGISFRSVPSFLIYLLTLFMLCCRLLRCMVADAGGEQAGWLDYGMITVLVDPFVFLRCAK